LGMSLGVGMLVKTSLKLTYMKLTYMPIKAALRHSAKHFNFACLRLGTTIFWKKTYQAIIV